MSYYATFKPTEEAIEELKKKDPLPHIHNIEDYAEELQQELLIACMKPKERTVRSALFMFRMYLNTLKNIAHKRAIEEAVQQFKSENEIYYCGWDKSKEFLDWDIEHTIKSHVKDLIMFEFLIDTKDYYNQEEHELFYKKLNNITELIDGFNELAYDWAIFEVMQDLVKYRTGEDSGEDSWWKEKSEVWQQMQKEKQDKKEIE